MPEVRELEVQRLRDMSADQKVAIMDSLWRQARALKAAGLRALHPDWLPEQVEAEVRALFRHPSL